MSQWRQRGHGANGVRSSFIATAEGFPEARFEALAEDCYDSRPDPGMLFLGRELATFQAAGYPTHPSFSSNPVLGYAYSNDDSDSDGDGLVDGMDYVVGLNPFSVNSDGDALADAVEYPLAGVPGSDPCSHTPITCLVQVPLIFRNGFR